MNDTVTDETSDIFGETLADEPWGGFPMQSAPRGSP